ncbi:uncharacterized protein EI90DRAFT_3121204 [Cantharellus anzutake]|uniref:uncharacterized protein n=1 Tax=Cantharellus anzutake TaxID=1750568 RepID=UPI001904A2F7|nr:uncharacterized protein EI90DRAFT_3121204 [Cantharellus anzutake]KAF8334742.1 hypothetical protein EI90DRAFT_3121204 [Cantharellus anzutake]
MSFLRPSISYASGMYLKQWLSVLRHQPAPYNAACTIAEFPFINPIFVPVSQRDQLPADVVHKTILPAISTYTKNLGTQRQDADIKVVHAFIPRISFKIGGKLIGTNLPSTSQQVKNVVEEVAKGQEDGDGDNSLPGDVRKLITKALVNPASESLEDIDELGMDDTDEEDGPDWVLEVDEK